MTINLYLGDSLEAMRQMPDKFYDLAIVDPPYGIDTKNAYSGSGKLKKRTLNADKKIEKWDIAPPVEYFSELERVSKNRIIWGGNYFPLPPTRCVICWDKVQPWQNFSQWEMAWTSYDKPAKLYKYDTKRVKKIHPTQKPVELYKWILEVFAHPGDKILDTHLGSGSIAIACHDMGYDLDAWEIDPDYFNLARDRVYTHTRQMKLL
jgi:site-specific DNA-methyltransferase (adenine-specific)